MKNKNLLYIIAVGIISAALTGCGPSSAKLIEAESARDLLVEEMENAEETYLDITDDSEKKILEDLSKKVDEIREMDFKKMSDKKIDEILPEISNITSQYRELGKELTGVLETETGIKEEKAKHEYLDVYFINKTGMNLSKIVLHDISKDTYSDDYIGEGVNLLSGYTLMGVTLDINKSSMQWEFVVTDEGGTDYSLVAESLRDAGGSAEALVLTYDSQKGEGEATFAKAEKVSQEETEAATEEISDASQEASEESTETKEE